MADQTAPSLAMEETGQALGDDDYSSSSSSSSSNTGEARPLLILVPVGCANKDVTSSTWNTVAEVPRHLVTSRPECVVPAPEGDGDANKALQAFVLAMEEEGLAAIARFAPTK